MTRLPSLTQTPETLEQLKIRDRQLFETILHQFIKTTTLHSSFYFHLKIKLNNVKYKSYLFHSDRFNVEDMYDIVLKFFNCDLLQFHNTPATTAATTTTTTEEEHEGIQFTITQYV